MICGFDYARVWDVDYVSSLTLVKTKFTELNFERISSDLNTHISAHKMLNEKYKVDINSMLSNQQIKDRLINQLLFLAALAIKMVNIGN